jgi:hypothetical protein
MPSVSVFVSELVGALTERSRNDVVEALNRATQMPPGFGLSNATASPLRKHEVEWFDSGAPLAIFHERVDSLTPAEGAAILALFLALRVTHGAAFPFRELDVVSNATGSEAGSAVLRDSYEDLRTQASKGRGPGHAIFLRHGMREWIEVCCSCMPAMAATVPARAVGCVACCRLLCDEK